MENTTVALQQQSNKTYNDEYIELSDAIKQIESKTGEKIEKSDIEAIADGENRISKNFINFYCRQNSKESAIYKDTKVY